MATSDWLPGAIVGGVTGLGGWVTAWIQRPAAAERAATARATTESVLEHRRWLISNGRSMVGAAQRQNTPTYEVCLDDRFLALRPHLRPDVADEYIPLPPRVTVQSNFPPDHSALLAEIDRLEREWKLA